ncbi:MAG: ketoacyl-ACP synthase III, partial [Planctomycetes bacterium]|nr:ketoacyl-ACP synthase III [Planctomycetota bacterium]
MLHAWGAGHYFPETVITNAFLTDLDIGVDDAWVLDRVGIKERRSVLPLDYIRDTRNSDPRAAREAATISCAEMGAAAARLALDRAGVDATDIGLIVAGVNAGDGMIPARAFLIARELGVEPAAFDLTAGCATFHSILALLDQFSAKGSARFVLVVLTEAMTRHVDYHDRTTAVLFGDGASALVVSTTEQGKAQVLACRAFSSPEGAGLITLPHAGHFAQEGRKVQRFAIRESCREIQRLREEVSDLSSTHHFIGHQANRMMLSTICEREEITADRHH